MFVISIVTQGTKTGHRHHSAARRRRRLPGPDLSWVDTAFNVAFVSGLFIGAATLNATGHSPVVRCSAAAAGYGLLAAWYGLTSARATPQIATIMTLRAQDAPIMTREFRTAGGGSGRGVGMLWDSAQRYRGPATASAGRAAPVERSSFRKAPGLADERTRGQAEQLHDRVAVEIGADAGEVLLGRDPGDPLLERVVVGRQLRGLPPVAQVTSDRVR